MKTAIVIPARFGSSRFPGKPLADIVGKSLIQRVHDIAKAVENVDMVLVATDDERIKEHVESFGGAVVMTPESCRNGTERVWAAVETLDEKPDVVINFQGDAVLTPPWTIQAVVDDLQKNETIRISTPAVRMTDIIYEKLNAAKQAGEVGGTTVTFDKNHNALYFSKNIIPYVRERLEDNLPVFRHIGLYGYRYDTLKEYLTLQPTILEQTEQLEQLRALENGIPIHIVEVDYKGKTHWAVDTPEDAKRAEEIIRHEGELVS